MLILFKYTNIYSRYSREKNGPSLPIQGHKRQQGKKCNKSRSNSSVRKGNVKYAPLHVFRILNIFGLV